LDTYCFVGIQYMIVLAISFCCIQEELYKQYASFFVYSKGSREMLKT